MGLYHEGARELQDRFDSRRIADRLEQVTLHDTISGGDAAFIARCAMVFLATADRDGQPDVSYKGGLPGFVTVVDEHTLALPHYDGNGMFRSLGNVMVHPPLALLFIDFARPQRLRVLGRGAVSADDPLMATWPGAQLVLRVAVERVFPNCPRYIHHAPIQRYSAYVPRGDEPPPVPDWKRAAEFRDALPDPAAVRPPD